MKRFRNLAVIAAVFLGLMTGTAAAHGNPKLTGMVWISGFFNDTVNGNAAVRYNHSHAKMYIRVQLQRTRNCDLCDPNNWAFVDGTSREKTDYNIPTISRQTSYSCPNLSYVYDYRIFAYYETYKWNAASGYVLIDSRTFVRDRTPVWCG